MEWNRSTVRGPKVI